MAYDYSRERAGIFTEDGQTMFLKIRDKSKELLALAGACTSGKLMCTSGDSWQMLACIDRLVELGELREITSGSVAGQNRVFVVGK